MDTKTIIILAVAAVVLFAVLGMVLASRKKSGQHHGQLKDEFDLTVKTMGGERKLWQNWMNGRSALKPWRFMRFPTLTMSAIRPNGRRSKANS